MKINANRAFSLIELLVVISVMTLLTAAAVPGFSSLFENVNLSSGGHLIKDQIGLARQLAFTKSSTVEVRIIKLPNHKNGYQAIQLWISSLDGMIPARPLAQLPDGIIISEDSEEQSPILTLLGQDQMPSYGKAANAPFVYFYIRPSGAVITETPASSRSDLYFSIIPEKEMTSKKKPSGYVTIQLNPETGTTAVYLP